MVNLRSGERIPLPDRMRRRIGGSPGFRVVIQAATLSSAAIQEQTIGAAIVVVDRTPLSFHWEMMFWRVGSEEGFFSAGLTCDLSPPPFEDLLYFDEAFHFLTNTEGTIVIKPHLSNGTKVLQMQAPVERRSFLAASTNGYQCPVMARYLVESRGRLLMVVRLGQGRPLKTTGFRVFEMQKILHPEHGISYAWMELETLDGRMLSRGCSRSYNVPEFPGLQEGVFFKADVQFWSRWWINLTPQGRHVLLKDNGFWSGPAPGNTVQCFRLPEQLQGTLDHTPVWFVPGSA